MKHATLAALLILVAPFALPQRLAPAAEARQTPPAPATPSIPATVFVKDAPKDAKDLRETKAAAQKGEIAKGASVTIRGRIGGRAAPFVKGRAIFFLADARLVACNEKPGDTCKVPWDFCCETPESLKANTATIQIVGTDGKPLKVAAEGAGGMKPLSKVTIVGTISDVSKEGTFVVNATAIHVE
jgi:hypothetical protein